MPIRLSVIVCTYNPDPVVFGRCLSSISTALGRVSDAEVVVVDNNSTMPVRELPLPDVARSDAFRWVSEEVQGLTPARLRGIRESHGDLLVFVDDDNFVREDFFERGIETAGKHPYIGSFSGQVFLVFEKEPPAWTIPYHGLLVRREFQSDTWSNIATLDDTMPCGAGLYVRREVAEHYLYLNDTGKRKMKLDRSGESLLSAGDNDLAACACDLGLGLGLFQRAAPRGRGRQGIVEATRELSEALSLGLFGCNCKPIFYQTRIRASSTICSRSDLWAENFFHAEAPSNGCISNICGTCHPGCHMSPRSNHAET